MHQAWICSWTYINHSLQVKQCYRKSGGANGDTSAGHVIKMVQLELIYSLRKQKLESSKIVKKVCYLLHLYSLYFLGDFLGKSPLIPHLSSRVFLHVSLGEWESILCVTLDRIKYELLFIFFYFPCYVLLYQTADWWSVGVILFEVLVGIPPFNAETPQVNVFF